MIFLLHASILVVEFRIISTSPEWSLSCCQRSPTIHGSSTHSNVDGLATAHLHFSRSEQEGLLHLVPSLQWYYEFSALTWWFLELITDAAFTKVGPTESLAGIHPGFFVELGTFVPLRNSLSIRRTRSIDVLVATLAAAMSNSPSR